MFSTFRVRAVARARALVFGFSIVTAFVLSSCIPAFSIYPLATPGDTLWGESRLWVATSPETVAIRFALESSSGVWSTYTSDTVLHWTMRPVQLGGRWFADIIIPGDFLEDVPLDSAHLFARLDLSGDTLRLQTLMASKLAAFDTVNPGWVRLAPFDDDGNLMLTSKTKELRRFLSRYGGVDSLFQESNDLIREH